MKSYKFSFVLLLVAILSTVSASLAQGVVFNDPSADYSFDLPDVKWKMTVKPSATSPNVAYVYGDRFYGHLEVRKLPVVQSSILTDVIRDEETKVQFRQGFVAGKEENFAGRLKGAVFNFEYVADARNMAGRFYFLRVNDTTVYLLRFSGQKDSLRSIRHQTDSIARTFSVR